MAGVEWWHFSDVELIRVVDGDTLHVKVTVDIGFHASAATMVTVRLDGINCPEKNTPEGKAATAFVNRWFVGHPGPISLATRKGQEKYGRWLGTISVGTEILNDDLKAAGFAVDYHGGTRI
ncbi:thermonuclease family protein [Streptosporangium sandarakinum]